MYNNRLMHDRLAQLYIYQLMLESKVIVEMASEMLVQTTCKEETLENSITAFTKCNSEAQVYNDIGDFCLNCWQTMTYSNV